MSFSILSRWISRVSQHPRQQLQRTMASAGESGAADKQNRLAAEKSPYLLQHAANPVHWYPWGEEAFSVARQENKLIFLSVGYSTCHWCHVMERESFENPDIAKIMNTNFVNVKVDREERPDVDKVYMTFVQSFSGSGGWPMSVWLTPELRPVYGGTYFPPDNRYFGQPGFAQILVSIASQWQESPDKFKESGSKILEVLERTSKLAAAASTELPGEEAIAKCFDQLSRAYEPKYGGFSESPKFPQPSNFDFLFTYHALYKDLDDAKLGLKMALHSLTMMAQGGIHDHIAQGFARYSTDEKWHVPHFEKMLYDQAQLVNSYLDAYTTTGQEKFAHVVRDILSYVLRDLSHPSGGFYSAEDADSLPTAEAKEKREGAFCVWTHEEVNRLLTGPMVEGSDTSLAQLFCHHYSVMEGGNVNPYQDPHDELKHQNVLMEQGTVEETAQEFEVSVQECEAALARARHTLYTARQNRPRPHLDDKMVTAWNGMMLGACARAGVVLRDHTYTQRALQAMTFIKDHLIKDGKLLRAAYTGPDKEVSMGSCIGGFLDDYAWVVRGLIQLYEATLDPQWLELAEKLQDTQDQLFWDPDSSGYFMTQTGDDSILLRIKEDQDGAEPSANSVSVGNLVRLSPLLDRTDYSTKAEAIFRLFSDRLNKIPIALPEMMAALLLHHKPPVQIILTGRSGSESLQDMLEVTHREALPNRLLMLADSNQDSILYTRHSSLTNYMPKTSDETLAYVCKNFRCMLPVNTPDLLRNLLKDSAVSMQQ